MAETDLDDLAIVDSKTPIQCGRFQAPPWARIGSTSPLAWMPLMSKKSRPWQGCSSLAESNCGLQSGNGAPVIGYSCKSNCSSKLWLQRWQEESNILPNNMDLCLPLRHSIIMSSWATRIQLILNAHLAIQNPLCCQASRWAYPENRSGLFLRSACLVPILGFGSYLRGVGLFGGWARVCVAVTLFVVLFVFLLGKGFRPRLRS